MGFLKKIWSFLKVKRSDGMEDHPELTLIDIDQLKKELNIASEAKRHGQAGIPTQDSKTLSSTEADIVRRVEVIRANYHRWALDQKNRYEAIIGERDISATINRTLKSDEEYLRAANAAISNNQLLISKLQEKAELLKKDLADFCGKNNLTRQPDYPLKAVHKLMYVIVGGILVVVESVANASFFAAGMDGGLVDGFLQAALLACVNLAIPSMSGRFWIPSIHHINPIRKLWGVLGIMTTGCVMVAVALGISHFRDAMGSGAEGMTAIGTVAYESLVKSPFGLTDIYSWALFGISIVFGIIALAEGYKFDDAYPGYGSIHRSANRAIAAHHALVGRIRRDITDLKDDFLDEIEANIEEAKLMIDTLRNTIDDKESSNYKLKLHLSKADESLNTLIMFYRDENRIARGERPAPVYFNELPTVKSLDFPSFDTELDREKLLKQEKLMATLIEKVEQIRASIQSAYDSRFNQLQPIQDQ